MSDIYYRWHCENPECESKNNKVPKDLVKRSINLNKRLHIYCKVCGFAPVTKRIKIRDRSGTAINTCDCIEFVGRESLLPMEKISAMIFKDYNGDDRSREAFLNDGIRPETYLKWVYHNKQPNHVDLDKV